MKLLQAHALLGDGNLARRFESLGSFLAMHSKSVALEDSHIETPAIKSNQISIAENSVNLIEWASMHIDLVWNMVEAFTLVF